MDNDMWSHGKNRMASVLERLLEPPKPKKKWYQHIFCCYKYNKTDTDSFSNTHRE
jgi:hypothetical protein